jgi:mannose-6-phosphate isomerase-like protein (cupin superfamily)
MISRQTAEHFTWRDVCDGWYLVNQPDRLTVWQECMPPGSSEVRHLHRQAYQFFFILAGTATLEINGQRIQLHPFEGAAIPPQVAHQMMNRSRAPLEFLVISQPNSRDDRVLLEALEGERPRLSVFRNVELAQFECEPISMLWRVPLSTSTEEVSRTRVQSMEEEAIQWAPTCTSMRKRVKHIARTFCARRKRDGCWQVCQDLAGA